MIVKVFEFSIRLSEPALRSIRAVGRLYALRDGELIEIRGQSRAFAASEDALDFDLEFSDTLRLSVADVVHASSTGEFSCKVEVCEAEGRVLKLYDVIEDGSRSKLVMIFEQEGSIAVKRSVKRVADEAQLNKLLKEVVSQTLNELADSSTYAERESMRTSRA